MKMELYLLTNYSNDWKPVIIANKVLAHPATNNTKFDLKTFDSIITMFNTIIGGSYHKGNDKYFINEVLIIKVIANILELHLIPQWKINKGTYESNDYSYEILKIYDKKQFEKFILLK